ncbi:hypothetical protein J1605_009071, partial [Eschrichtius robustus]
MLTPITRHGEQASVGPLLGAAASTANLLDDVEGHTCDEDFRGRRQEVPKVEEALREG